MIDGKKRIFISAGDPSGDIHAANLMREIIAKDETISFVGIGGSQMQALGLETIVEFEEINVVGFWEVAKKYNFFKKLETKSKDLIKNSNIDLVILIDYPGLNIRLASYAKSIGKNVCYYIAPQLWAWGKKRAEKLASSVDKLLVVFPFEVDYFKKFGLDVEFVGHPLLDLEIFDERESSERIKNQICLVPGSRAQEIDTHLKLFSELIRISGNRYKFALSKSPSVSASIYDSFIAKHPQVKIYDNSREAMKASKFGIVKAGTSTLEATLLNLPFIAIYKASPLTYMIGKSIINIEYLAMPNILMKSEVIKELIQQKASARNILDILDIYMNNMDLIIMIENNFKIIRKMLGKDSAKEKASEIIYNTFLK